MKVKGIIIQGPCRDRNEAKAKELADTLPEESVIRINARNLSNFIERNFLDCDINTHMIIFEEVNRFDFIESFYNIIGGLGAIVLPGSYPPMKITPIFVFIMAAGFKPKPHEFSGASFNARFFVQKEEVETNH